MYHPHRTKYSFLDVLVGIDLVLLRLDFFTAALNAGVATAFAARDVLGNVLSGFSMQFSKPFSLGDTIKVCYHAFTLCVPQFHLFLVIGKMFLKHTFLSCDSSKRTVPWVSLFLQICSNIMRLWKYSRLYELPCQRCIPRVT